MNRTGWAALAVLLSTAPRSLPPDPVPVRFSEGSVHGFLVLRAETDSVLAWGDLLQVPGNSTLESRLILRFRDRSYFEETTTFTQHRVFRLVSYRLVQRGPAFEHDLDARVQAGGAYRVTAIERKDADTSSWEGTMDLPEDVSNGLPIILAKNLPAGDSVAVHLLAFTPKPRLIDLRITPAGTRQLRLGERTEEVQRFRLSPHLGGLTGVAARALGKMPPDSYTWIATEKVPTFVQFQGPLYTGPTWRLSLATPELEARAPAAEE